MALSTTYNVAGDREDLTDFLTILAPEDTPKISTFAKTKRMTNAYQEWQVDTLGNVDFGLVGCLLIGSIPGGLIGAQLSTRVPIPWLRRILCAVLLVTGARMLWA